MAEAVFLVDVDAEKSGIVDALTTQDGIEGWWTTDAKVTEKSLDLGFPGVPARFDLSVQEANSDSVVWASAGDFPPHWVGTKITWQIMDNPEASGSRVFFIHEGFDAPDPMLGHTAYTWALLMGHLKGYTETGTDQPFFE